MVQSIILTGVAIGCVYALIAVTYNVMFSASRVFSFTAGTLGMLGGVLGALFIARMGMPVALALMVQQFPAINWSTEPQPFPRLFDIARVDFDQQFWLPMLACVAVIVGLEFLYRFLLLCRAFLAIS